MSARASGAGPDMSHSTISTLSGNSPRVARTNELGTVTMRGRFTGGYWKRLA